MNKISNKYLLSLLCERDKKSVFHADELVWLIKKKFYNDSTFGDDIIFLNIESERIKQLIRDLYDEDYCLTDSDIALLRKYNVFANCSYDKSGSFVAISDFHGLDYPLDKVLQHYINEYGCVYILGDAIDRGEDLEGSGGLELLLKIKDLTQKFPNRVVYLPGNHDEFLIGYAKNKGENYERNLLSNGGRKTIEDLERLYSKDKKKYDELLSWLGKCPIQRVHHYQGKKYVLAHALFNQALYDYNPYYCLDDYFMENPNSKVRRMAFDSMWYRKERDGLYNPKELPMSDVSMVVGHTPLRFRKGLDLNQKDINNRDISVYCVDGGIAYGNSMLKYDGGSAVSITLEYAHNDASFDINKVNERYENSKAILHNFIITSLYENGKNTFDENSDKAPDEISVDDSIEVIYSYNGKYGFNYMNWDRPLEVYSMYKKIFVFDYILENIIAKENNFEQGKELAQFLVNGYLFGGNSQDDFIGDLTCFTRYKDTRYFAEMLGSDNMKEVLLAHNCENVNQYIDLKFSKEKDVKVRRY